MSLGTAEFLVRTGINGDVGVFSNRSHQRLRRDEQVICETERGLEVGEVLTALEGQAWELDHLPSAAPVGMILRRVTPNDRLLIERLARYRDQAFLACEQLLRQRNSTAVLLDVEQLFDGENLFFYFMGPLDESLESVLTELSSTYERKIRFRQFAQRLAEGCGPSCGTHDHGCSSGGCGSCTLAGNCRPATRT